MRLSRSAQRAPFLDRAPGLPFHLICLLAAGYVLWTAAFPAGSVLGFLVAFFGLGGLALVWLVRLLVVAGRGRRVGRAFAVAPVGGVLVLALLGTGVPLQVTWALSSDDFEQAVRTGRTLERPGEQERIGLYPVVSIDPVPGGTVFFVVGGSFDDGGFAHLPDGPAQVIAADRFESPAFRPLGGGWYSWTSSW